MAKSGIETACWDLEAKKLGVPLWRHLGGVNQVIECGVSIGIQDSIAQLLEKIRVEVEAGYKRIKIKISPSWDYDVIKAVRKEFGDILLMGDANSAYTLDDIDMLKSLDEFDLIRRPPQGAHESVDPVAAVSEDSRHSPAQQPVDNQVRYQLFAHDDPFISQFRLRGSPGGPGRRGSR
jgi:O-succinylbenzoate synthase